MIHVSSVFILSKMALFFLFFLLLLDICTYLTFFFFFNKRLYGDLFYIQIIQKYIVVCSLDVYISS